MASPLRLLRHGVKGMDLGHGLVGWGLNGGLAYGTGYGVAQLRHRYHDKWYGEHAPRIAAIAGKGLAVVTQLLTGGPSVLSGGLDTVGDSGLALIGAMKGFDHATTATNSQLLVAPRSRALGPGERKTRLGEIPAGQRGRAMSLDEIAELASDYH